MASESLHGHVQVLLALRRQLVAMAHPQLPTTHPPLLEPVDEVVPQTPVSTVALEVVIAVFRTDVLSHDPLELLGVVLTAGAAHGLRVGDDAECPGRRLGFGVTRRLHAHEGLALQGQAGRGQHHRWARVIGSLRFG